MPKTVDSLALPLSPPGVSTALTVHRYGRPGARPKVYVQGGLHADEPPGMMAALALIGRLDALAEDDAVRGEVVVVPAANPIGLGQRVFDAPVGRFDLGGGGNFNRHYPDLVDTVAGRVGDALTPDADRNVALIRQALSAALAERRPATLADALRHQLLALAIDADIVLDLHCDSVAPVHIYLGTPLWPAAQDLARRIGAQVVLLAEVSGGEPFDEACSAPWWRLADVLSAGAERPVPPACLAATVELRGQADVSDPFAARDADALIAFLQDRGVVAGTPPPAPDLTARVGPLAAVDHVSAPAAGLFVPAVRHGDAVEAGDIVGRIVDPLAPDPAAAAAPVRAAAEGLVFTAVDRFVVRAGDVVLKIAGDRPLAGKGSRLLTA